MSSMISQSCEIRKMTSVDRDDDAQAHFIEAFGLLLAEAGMPRMAARAFAAILSDDARGLTAGELGRRLGASAAAISGAVRYLTKVGMVRKVREPGARVDQYGLGDDVWYELLVERDAMLTRWERTLAEGAAALGDGPGAQRLRDSQEYYAFLREELAGLGARWRARRESRS
jgi:hypothetical protein